MKSILKILTKNLIRIISSVFLLVIAYAVFAFVFSIIPVNRKVVSNHELDIYIRSNGVHLDIILPLRNEIKDWTKDIWIDNQIINTANFVSFGWGDKLFYLNTPEWSDLTFRTAFIATFLRSPSALHIDYYKDLQTDDNCKMIPISNAQYKTIVNFIEDSFEEDSSGNKILIRGFQTTDYDCFYEAEKSYNLFNTCNTWTNKCLMKSGLRASLWTPFDRGTLYHYRKLEAE